ncbi:TOG array regulator of axonemal microtubules protein 2 [Telopea speciosissima]|uniref:TOG array regulator of axonemal microtubules protein 2 n=1 Tax=Telopea speciosissima TaxID=54955 RepID=UPI001CC774F8|nr:TOG array regulator of axonemal microtubules protein 2 [Telopea speciosissima]
MALRSLDNALPIVPERPKKLAKAAVCIPKSSDLGVNDENKVPMPAAGTGDSAIDYIASDDLKPIEDPETKIQTLMEELDSKDWMKVCESLNHARGFAIHHPSFLLPILDKVMLVMVKSTNNPRSALCKVSIMASSDIFKSFGEKIVSSDAFDPLLLQLLLKASQDKKFVREEAEKALQGMVESLPPLALLNKLLVCVTHSNLRIRAKAAVSISKCVSKMGLEGMKEFGLVSLIQVAADLLNDRLPEARDAARSTVILIYEAVIQGEEQNDHDGLSPMELWQSFCCSNLTAIQAQSMTKIIPS